jgi:hypothetical protein
MIGAVRARFPSILLALLTTIATPALAQKTKLHLERADVSAYPLLKLYLTFVDGDGRVLTGRTKDDFKLIFDSNEQGPAADAKPIDATGEPVYLVAVAQVRARCTRCSTRRSAASSSSHRPPATSRDPKWR